MAAQAGRNAQAAALGVGRRNCAHAGSLSAWPPVVRELDNPFLAGLVSRELGDDLALVHDQNPVAHAEDFRQLRRNHQNADAALGKLAHELINLELGPDVDTARRLVENDRRRRRLQPFREDDFLLIAAAQVLRLELRGGHGDRQLALRPPDRLGFLAALNHAEAGQLVQARQRDVAANRLLEE